MKACGGVALPLGFPNAPVGSLFGMRNTRTGPGFHRGMDLHAPEGTTVHSVLAGTVTAIVPSGELDRFGNTVIVQHAPRLFLLYAHLQGFAPGLRAGMSIASGALLGRVGRTAGTGTDPSAVFKTSKPHLHLEVLNRWPVPRGATPAAQGARTDPALFLAQLGISIPGAGRMSLRCPEDLPPGRGPRPIRPIRPAGAPEGPGTLLLLALLLWARQSRN